MPNIILTPPRVPLVDPRTGLVDRAWYLFFRSLNSAANDFINNPQVGPSPESLIASYDAALQALAQNVETQPLPVDLSAELTKQIEAAGLADYATGLLSQMAEMQKQLEALNLLPPPSQGTVVAVTATAPVASSGGIAPNISMAAANTSTDGYLTSTDWNTFNNKAPATSGTSILYGDGFGGFSNVSTGSGVSFVAGVLSATGSGGTITSVTATAPIASSGGFTPNISINAAYGDTVNPYAAKTANFVLAGPTSGAAAVPTFRALVASDIPTLSYVTSVSGTAGRITSTGGTTPVIDLASGVATPGTTGSSTQVPVITIDTYGRVTSITTAANPQGTVTSVAASVPSFLSISGSPITTSGTLAIGLSGTALPTTSGGTGLTSFTANGVVYASSTSALATGSALTFDGTNLATTGTASATKLIPTGGAVTGNGMYLPAANSLGFSTNGVDAIRVDSNQNAGVGMTAPSSVTRLHVANANIATLGTQANMMVTTTDAQAVNVGGVIGLGGSVTTGSPSLNMRLFGAIRGAKENSSDGFTDGYLSFLTMGGFTATPAEWMRISSTGIVTMNAYGAGAATFSAAGVISSVSDETWKTKDGVPVDPDAMLKKLQPGYWYYNEEKRETFGKDRQLGFYAQNVNAAIGPEAAPEPEEGKPWGYYDRSVLAVVVMSLQNALDTIDSLTARIAALEQK